MLTTLLILASLAQCPSGSCAMPTANYAYFTPAPRYTFTAPAPASQLWQLADRTGQVWTHRNPAYLQAWVARRNGTVLTTPGRRP